MATYEESAAFYRGLSIKCNEELERLWAEKKRREEKKLKKANTITTVSVALFVVVLICSPFGVVPIMTLVFPIIGLIYGIVSTPTGNDMDSEYWDKRMEVVRRYLGAWQRSQYYCNLPYQYIKDFREISVEYWADLSGLRFKPSHPL